MRGRPSSADRPAGKAPRRARHTAGLADGTKVRSVSMQDLHSDMLRTFAAGLRAGVHVEVLDGLRAYRDVHSLTVVNQRQGRLRQLEEAAAEARDRARNARANANEEPDADVRADYQDDARRHTIQARQLEEEANRIRSLTEGAGLPDSFEGEVDFLLSGLSALLATADGRVSDEQAAALKSILHDFTITLDGSRVRWSASLLVPADERVVALGPFTGTVAAHGRVLTSAEIGELPDSAGAAQRRRVLIHRLEEAGFPRHLARAASLAPGGYLPRVLLGEAVTWPSCDATFDHAAFNQHLRAVWGAHPGWSASVYCQTNPSRQALADLVASRGGSASLADLEVDLALMGISRNDVYSMTLPKPARNPATPPWPPTVERTTVWASSEGTDASLMANPICPLCGNPATAVIRVPEVTDALLCRGCQVMPSNKDLQFPPLYLDLALP